MPYKFTESDNEVKVMSSVRPSRNEPMNRKYQTTDMYTNTINSTTCANSSHLRSIETQKDNR